MERSNIFREIIREYDSDQAAAQNLRERRQATLYNRLPRVRQIDREMADIGLSLARLALTAGGEGVAKAKRKAGALAHEKRVLLLNEGIPEDYLTDIYRCSVCADTGFIGLQDAAPQRCNCFNQRMINKCYAMSNLGSVLSKENFAKFKLTHFSQTVVGSEGLSPRDNINAVRKIAERFAKDFKPGDENLFFYGTTGLGKTFLCHCIAKAVLDKGFIVLYITAPHLFKLIQERHFNRDNADDESGQLDTVQEADLLILDDLGAEFSTIVTDSALFEVINQRLLDKRSTVISSNLTITELRDQYTERIVSRFIGSYKMFKFFGDDIREKKRYQQTDD
ncbi:MAG: ATP-binding protein [Defluviitaleaceae bacterium]|nr:ATP-binding protein [Defluviitaleaceae bacterium]